MNNDNVLGERVRKRREELNLTQEELAKRAGYQSRSSINNIESGRPASQKIVSKLAKALGVTPSYLMGWDDLPNKNDLQGLDQQDTKPLDLQKFAQPTKSDAKVFNNANEITRYHTLIEFLKSCNWNVSKIAKGTIVNGITTDQTYYAISKSNGVAINLTYDEFQLLQDKLYDSIETTILDEFKSTLGL